MIPIETILLDLDGVIRDWDRAIFNKFDIPYRETYTYEGICNLIKKEHGISNNYFWELQDKEFWLNMEFYPHAQSVLDLLPYDKTYLMTAPTKNNAGWSQEWIRRNLPNFFRDKKYLIGPAKYLCANPKALLIDDYDKNVDAFRNKGGYAIEFPQCWNRLRVYKDDRLEYLKIQLEQFEF